MVRVGGRPLGLLYLAILRVSYGYGYTRGSGRVGSGSNFRHGSGTGEHHRGTGTGRVAEMLDPYTPSSQRSPYRLAGGGLGRGMLLPAKEPHPALGLRPRFSALPLYS